MRRLNDREWVDHCTAAISEELPRLATGAVFLVFTWLNINEIAGVTAVGSAISLLPDAVSSKNSNLK